MPQTPIVPGSSCLVPGRFLVLRAWCENAVGCLRNTDMRRRTRHPLGTRHQPGTRNEARSTSMTCRLVVVSVFAAATVIGVCAQQSAGPAALHTEWPRTLKVEGIEILHVQKSIYMLAGAGGNVTIQVGDEGVAMVDSGSSGMAEKILAAVGQVSRKPVRFLVNTNADPDHVAGNGPIVTASGGTRGPTADAAPVGARSEE